MRTPRRSLESELRGTQSLASRLSDASVKPSASVTSENQKQGERCGQELTGPQDHGNQGQVGLSTHPIFDG